MKRYIIDLLWLIPVCLLMLLTAYCNDASANEFRIGIGADVYADIGNPAVEALYVTENAEVMVMRGQDIGTAVGAAYRVSPRGWGVGLFGGVAYLQQTNRVNGTNLNFNFGAEKCWDKWCLLIRHFSNGSYFHIGPEDKPNRGWNYLMLDYRFN